LDFQGRARRRWLALFPYTRSVVVAGVIVASGIACAVPLIVYYFGHHERLSLTASLQDGLAVTGLLLMVIGASLFTFTLVLHGAAITSRRSSAGFERVS
jgi:VIT1/CCC1 family predicted Fe2+/Mn2+ transporter